MPVESSIAKLLDEPRAPVWLTAKLTLNELKGETGALGVPRVMLVLLLTPDASMIRTWLAATFSTGPMPPQVLTKPAPSRLYSMPFAAVCGNTSEASLVPAVCVAVAMPPAKLNVKAGTTRVSSISSVDRRRLREGGGKPSRA